MCSYFTHFADDKQQEDAQRARQVRYYKECVIPAFPGDPKTAPPSYRYFVDMVERLQKVRPEDLTENSVLIGKPDAIAETRKKVEAAGFDAVTLFQCRYEAAWAGQGGDGPVHARGRAHLFGHVLRRLIVFPAARFCCRTAAVPR
jgi:hypothetical protein